MNGVANAVDAENQATSVPPKRCVTIRCWNHGNLAQTRQHVFWKSAVSSGWRRSQAGSGAHFLGTPEREWAVSREDGETVILMSVCLFRMGGCWNRAHSKRSIPSNSAVFESRPRLTMAVRWNRGGLRLVDSSCSESCRTLRSWSACPPSQIAARLLPSDIAGQTRTTMAHLFCVHDRP